MTNLSSKQQNKKALREALAVVDREQNVGWSFVMPVSMYGELLRLSVLTEQSMAYYARDALMRYLSTDEHIAHMRKLELREKQRLALIKKASSR